MISAEKEQQVRSDDFGRDLSSVQILLTKQEAFDAGLNAFEHEAFNSWFENAEEDLTDPVRCNSLEEISALREAHAEFHKSLSTAEEDFKQLQLLDKQIKSFNERELELQKEHRRQEDNDKLRRDFARQANAFHQWLTETRAAMMETSGTLEEQLELLKRKGIRPEVLEVIICAWLGTLNRVTNFFVIPEASQTQRLDARRCCLVRILICVALQAVDVKNNRAQLKKIEDLGALLEEY
uniref:Uncharacterized protein n=1 Tax=Parascaris equorum TaxID=6256 RepID=A0A914R6H7_PAREQ